MRSPNLPPSVPGRFPRVWLSALWLFLALLFLLPIARVAAHGEGQTLLVDHAPIGEFFLTVWAQPAVLRPGEVHFSAEVTDGTAAIVDGCTFEFAIRHLGEAGPAPVTLLSPPGPNEVAIILDASGRYDATVMVTEPGGAGQMKQFEFEIAELPRTARLTVQILTLGSMVVGAWLLMEGVRTFNLWRPDGRSPRRPDLPHHQEESE